MPEKTYQVSGQCPVCDSQMNVSRLECEKCGSVLEGHFHLGPFQNLTRDQLNFLEVFIRCRGQNKAIQELLNISYPTVIKKLDEVIVALGYEPDPTAERRREILEKLSQNKISALEAHQLLGNLNSARPSDSSEAPGGFRRNNSTGE